MSVSRDDFSIAFRSALLQRGGAQKFSVLSLIFLALVIFFLDVYGFTLVKTARSFINDIVYRVTYLASAPTRLLPDINKGITGHFNLKKENEELRQVIERYKSLDLNLEYISNENKNLKKVLTGVIPLQRHWYTFSDEVISWPLDLKEIRNLRWYYLNHPSFIKRKNLLKWRKG